MSSIKKYDEKRKLLNITIFKARNQYSPHKALACVSAAFLYNELSQKKEKMNYTHNEKS